MYFMKRYLRQGTVVQMAKDYQDQHPSLTLSECIKAVSSQPYVKGNRSKYRPHYGSQASQRNLRRVQL